MFTEIFFIGAMASAWNIIGGYANQTSWAHASFLAVGAYAGFLMYLQLNISPFISMFIGMGLSVLLAIIIGAPTFKLRGSFFAIATIACGTIVRQCLLYPPFTTLTGGANGLMLPAKEQVDVLFLNFTSEIPFYYIAFGMMIITLIIVFIVVQSKLGYYLRAIREDEDAAESLGIRTNRIKLVALIISAIIMSVLGTLYSFKIKYIDPQSVASYDMAIRIGITAIIGGLGTKWGPIVGAFVTIPLLELANYYFATLGGGGVGFAIYGLMMILIVLFQRDGLIAVGKRVKNYLVKKLSHKKNVYDGNA
jgi:branched-chain amino acid transport system permease protein